MSLIIDGSNGLTFPNSTTQASAGIVLQVVQSTVGNLQSSTTSTSFVSSPSTITITPKFSTSKILIIYSGVGAVSGTTYAGYTIYRNNTTNLSSGSIGFGIVQNVTGDTPITFTYLDSPATTSATTYTVYFRSSNGNTVFINENAVQTQMTVMEIAG